MSTTALTMITRAMRLMGAIGVGETPTDDESADGLKALQTMLDSWNTERLFSYYMVEETLTLSASAQSYTIGSGGDLNTTRPTHIDNSCFIRYNNIDFPLEIIEVQSWDFIPAKATQSNIPQYMYVEYGYPLITVSFWTYPTSAGAVAHIRSWKQLQSFTALTTVLSLPPGNERAITYSLAEEWAPEFGKTVPPEVAKIAVKARANLKRINSPMRVMRTEVGYMNRMRVWGNIYQGN